MLQGTGDFRLSVPGEGLLSSGTVSVSRDSVGIACPDHADGLWLLRLCHETIASLFPTLKPRVMAEENPGGSGAGPRGALVHEFISVDAIEALS